MTTSCKYLYYRWLCCCYVFYPVYLMESTLYYRMIKFYRCALTHVFPLYQLSLLASGNLPFNATPFSDDTHFYHYNEMACCDLFRWKHRTRAHTYTLNESATKYYNIIFFHSCCCKWRKLFLLMHTLIQMYAAQWCINFFVNTKEK